MEDGTGIDEEDGVIRNIECIVVQIILLQLDKYCLLLVQFMHRQLIYAADDICYRLMTPFEIIFFISPWMDIHQFLIFILIVMPWSASGTGI